MTERAFQALIAASALCAVVALSIEVAAIANRLQELADRIAAVIDPLTPAVGTTAEDVFAPFWDAGLGQ
jgi:hypothetical protein